jgi:hypothetical protein
MRLVLFVRKTRELNKRSTAKGSNKRNNKIPFIRGIKEYKLNILSMAVK